jgi:hypothetical protein
MSYLRHTFKILDDSEPNNSDVIGDPHSVIPSDLDDVSDADQKWFVFVTASQANGATSPTTDVIIETSFDGGNTWAEVAKATQLTADGGQPELIALKALGSWIRASKKLGGGTKPDSAAVVLLASNGIFKARGLNF